MTELRLQQTWELVLSTPEFRLVLRALGGRLGENEVGAARALGERLTTLRGSLSKDALRTAERLLNVDAKEGEDADAG